jgi:hypothetical protein
MIPANILHSIKPIEVEGKMYALKKGDSAYIPTKLASAMIKRGWAAKMQKPERLGEVEGAEVRDVSRWVKGLTGKQINRLKIGKNGFTVSFVDTMNVTAGKVYTPFYSSDNNEIKEAGFSAGRLANIFGTFKKGEKARLWWKGGDNPNLYIKETTGNLSWRHKLPNIEEATRIPKLKKIAAAAIKMDITDIAMLATINKGKRVADKYDFVAFCYAGKTVTVYAIHEERYTVEKDIIKLKELEAIEGKGNGIAIYRLEEVAKLLKGAKRGIVRIEESVPLKVSRSIGKESKAVAFLTPVEDEDLRRLIANSAGMAHKAEDNSPVEKAIEKEANMKEEVINETVPLDYIWTVIKNGIVENCQATGYKRGVKLEQSGGFFRVTIDGYFPHGYTTEAEAIKRYEWLTEVR